MDRQDSLLWNIINGPGMPNTANAPSTIWGIVIVGVNLMIGVGVSISVIAAAYSAWLYILSGGNPDKLSTAFKAAMWSVISLGVTIASVAIKNIVFNLLGASSNLAQINPN